MDALIGGEDDKEKKMQDDRRRRLRLNEDGSGGGQGVFVTFSSLQRGTTAKSRKMRGGVTS